MLRTSFTGMLGHLGYTCQFFYNESSKRVSRCGGGGGGGAVWVETPMYLDRE